MPKSVGVPPAASEGLRTPDTGLRIPDSGLRTAVLLTTPCKRCVALQAIGVVLDIDGVASAGASVKASS